MCVGGGQCGKKNVLQWALEAQVQKPTYGPLIDTFLGPKWHSPNDS